MFSISIKIDPELLKRKDGEEADEPTAAEEETTETDPAPES